MADSKNGTSLNVVIRGHEPSDEELADAAEKLKAHLKATKFMSTIRAGSKSFRVVANKVNMKHPIIDA